MFEGDKFMYGKNFSKTQHMFSKSAIKIPEFWCFIVEFEIIFVNRVLSYVSCKFA